MHGGRHKPLSGDVVAAIQVMGYPYKCYLSDLFLALLIVSGNTIRFEDKAACNQECVLKC